MKKNTLRKKQIAVIGSAGNEEYLLGGFDFCKIESIAKNLGYGLAKQGYILINGGKSGIMKSSALGCKEGGGIAVGIVRGDKRGFCNESIDVEIVTNIGVGGDGLMIPTIADACIVIGGGAGTLKEVCGFYLMKKPIIVMSGTGGWADRILSMGSFDERDLVTIEGANNVDHALYLLQKSL